MWISLSASAADAAPGSSVATAMLAIRVRREILDIVKSPQGENDQGKWQMKVDAAIFSQRNTACPKNFLYLNELREHVNEKIRASMARR